MKFRHVCLDVFFQATNNCSACLAGWGRVSGVAASIAAVAPLGAYVCAVSAYDTCVACWFVTGVENDIDSVAGAAAIDESSASLFRPMWIVAYVVA